LMARRAFALFIGIWLLAACTAGRPAVTARATPAPAFPEATLAATGLPESAAPTALEVTVAPGQTRSITTAIETRLPTPTVTSSPAPTATSSPTPPLETPAWTATPVPLTPTPRAVVQAQEQAAVGVVGIARIGDYGLASPAEEDVAKLVKSWRPDLIITTGDNNYPAGSPDTIDLNVGQFYHEFISPYRGTYGKGAEQNRFFPVLGNHDWMDPGARAYQHYFKLPGNGRYYDVAWGPVHLFALDSMQGEPDGIESSSKQAEWLHAGLAQATEPWKLVYMHHPPYSSGPHGPTRAMQWPFGEWGATAVLAGHDHIYERIAREGDRAVYFVNGLGGSVRYSIGQPVQGSQVRYSDDFGAMLIEADEQHITFRFVTRTGKQVDEYTINR
jgi:hypothetical protein